MRKYEDMSIEQLENRLEEVKNQKVVIKLLIIIWLIYMGVSLFLTDKIESSGTFNNLPIGAPPLPLKEITK